MSEYLDKFVQHADFIDAKFNEVKNQIKSELNAHHIDNTRNDYGDAVRHAYASARLAQEYGEDLTRKFGFQHEQTISDQEKLANPGWQREQVMDLYNNEIGRNIGTVYPKATPDQLLRLVMDRADTWECKKDSLILEPNDPRIDQLMPKYQKTLDQHWLFSEHEVQPAPHGQSLNPQVQEHTLPYDHNRPAHAQIDADMSPEQLLAACLAFAKSDEGISTTQAIAQDFQNMVKENQPSPTMAVAATEPDHSYSRS